MLTLVVSDTHMGNGGGFDIFAGSEDLAWTLDQLPAPTRVVFNGDTVDFLMNTDPLVLETERAVAQARDIAGFADTARVLEALGRVLARGGEAFVRLGNHDVELALPEVQEVFREAMRQPPEVASSLRFLLGDRPWFLDVSGVRVLVTHGEHDDPWNRVDYENLRDPADFSDFAFPAGSKLVKSLLNPAKREHGLRFADLLKPDFEGAVLTALAVAPRAFRGSACADVLAMYFREWAVGTASFGTEDGPQVSDLVDHAGLLPEEREAMVASFDTRMPASFGLTDALDAARLKLVKSGLLSRLQRWMVNTASDDLASLTPGESELADARRLAHEHDADVVTFGHTHAARFHSGEGCTFVNTGSWIWQLSMPASDAPDEVWQEHLELLASDPALEGDASRLLERRFTGLWLEPTDSGVRVVLRQCADRTLYDLTQTHVQRNPS